MRACQALRSGLAWLFSIGDRTTALAATASWADTRKPRADVYSHSGANS